MTNHRLMCALSLVLASGAAAAGPSTLTQPPSLSYTQNRVGAQWHLISDKLGETISVTDFSTSANFNGVTDDTPVFTAAAASFAGGAGVVEVPAGPTWTYKLGTILTLPKNVVLRFRGRQVISTVGIRLPDSTIDTTGISGIECPENATIKLANGANVDVIANTNFATLTGTSNGYGTFRAMINNCIVDGNKANNALTTTTQVNITSVTRASMVTSVVLASAPSPVLAVGDTVVVSGVTDDQFNGRYVVVSTSDSTHFTYGNYGFGYANTASSGGTVKGYRGGNGIRLFGRAMRMVNVTTQNCALDGEWTEGNDSGSLVAPENDDLEGYFVSIKHMANGGNGWTFKGPHDSRVTNTIDWGNGGWGEEVFQPIYLTGQNSYLNGTGGMHVAQGGSVVCGSCEVTNGAGWGVLIDVGTKNIFSATEFSCNGCIGIEMRAPFQVIQGAVLNSNIGVKFNGGGGNLTLTMGANTTWFDCTSENGTSIIDVTAVDSTGTVKGTGCWTGSEFLRLAGFGATPSAERFQVPGVLSGFFIAGWNPKFATSNSTLQIGSSQAPTYGATVSIAANNGSVFTIVATNGTAFTVAVPTTPIDGQVITIRIKNTSGGALGVATFSTSAGGYKLGAAWVQPATGFSRSITFGWDGTNWIELTRSAADVAN